MKVLIIRFSSIGDIVLTTPVIRSVKSELDAEVHFATKKTYQSILQDNPYIDKIHLLEYGLNELINQLKKEQYDYIIDLHNNLRSRIICTRLRKKSYHFKKLNLLKYLAVNFKLNRLPNKHIVDRYLDTAKPIGITGDQMGLDYFIPEKDIVDKDWLPKGFQRGYVALVIGAKFATKRLPYKRLIELCDRINKPIVLLGGPEDQELGQKIEEFFKQYNPNSEQEEMLRDKLGKKAIVFNACGKFNLNQSASLLKQSKVVFSHDTGLMHIAAAFKKKIFSIWGNTIPQFGMYPYKTSFVIFENNKIKCRPCSKIGFDKCPKGHFDCMNKLVFDFYIPDWK